MKAKYIVIFFLSLLSFVACDKEEVVIPTTAPRTVLIYFAGDNSLSGYVSQNLRAIKEGIERDGLNNGNLLIYTDKQNEAPQLFQLKLEADTIRQIVLETYDSNQNSASTETLTQIIDKVQKEYPADSYGLVLWSHGTGWLPSDIYSYLRSFGQDGKNNFMEINDLASALSKYHFDFILFDACYMSCADLLYNKTTIDAKTVSSWDCLWDPTYEDEIIMENSVRDTFAPALISKGYSLNDTDENHLREALDILKKQKDDKIVYAYYVDETADAMIGEEASIALCYSGEAALAMAENDNLDYSVPTEGSNLWIDSWFIPKSCTNQTNALKFLNFLCKDDIAEKNFEYVQYASPITSVVENQDADVKNNEAVNPSSDTIKRCEIYKALSDDDSAKYTKLWQELLSY